MKLELKWGLIIGLILPVVLYSTYFLGWHSRGLLGIQMVMLIHFGLTMLGYFMAIREMVTREPETTFREGLVSGLIIAGVTAVLALLTQLGYFTLINPGWTDYMVEQTRLYYLSNGATEEIATELSQGARKTFGLRSYLIQSASIAIVFGAFFTAAMMAVIRLRARRNRR
ncbi:MAG: DUF4199 domain-containing protein [Verrucomicrobiota bacterium]